MKRKSNLYEDIYKLENIEKVFAEVCRNTKNKKKVEEYKELKCAHIYHIYNMLKNDNYIPGKYNVFTIYEPKKRIIVSQEIEDKIVNHLVARYILYPAILPCLLDVNVASRKGLGTSRGIKLAMEYRRRCKVKYRRVLYFKV